MKIATYYCNDPTAPKPNQPTHLGANVLLEAEGKLLLERRSDCGQWGLVGGRIKKGERASAGIAREVCEETGLFLSEQDFKKLRIFDDERIAAYRDGSVWKMIIILFRVKLEHVPPLRCSGESCELRFFTPQELKDTPIVVTHSDIVRLWVEKYRFED